MNGLKIYQALIKDSTNYKVYNEVVIKATLDVKYPKDLHGLHSDLPSLPERIKINKCSKLVYNLYDKKLCCSHKILKKRTNIKESAQSNLF